MTAQPQTLGASDLFVQLERAFRRRAKQCRACAFTLPYRIYSDRHRGANWSVIASDACSPRCRSILEDLVAEYQSSYRLAGN